MSLFSRRCRDEVNVCLSLPLDAAGDVSSVILLLSPAVPDTSPTGSTSSRSQEQHHFVMFQKPHSSVSLPAADQTMQSDLPRVNQEEDDEADDEDDEGPQGRLIMDEDEDSAAENLSRKISGASDASSTTTIREELGAFSLGRRPETTQFSAFSQLAQTAAEEHMKLEAAGQLEKLSGGSQITGAFHPQFGSFAIPYGLPPVYRLAASAGTSHLPNGSPHQLAAASVINPSYLLTSPYAATLLSLQNPGIVRHPYLAAPSLYGLPPLLAVSQQTGGPPVAGFGTGSLYQASSSSPTQIVSPSADSTVLSTQGSGSSNSVSSSTISQSDQRTLASALYKSLPKSNVCTPSICVRFCVCLECLVSLVCNQSSYCPGNRGSGRKG